VEEFRGGERPWMGVMPNATRRECVRWWFEPTLSDEWWCAGWFAGPAEAAVEGFDVAVVVQCKGAGDGALELGVLDVPTPPVDPRWWKPTGLPSLLDGRGGRFLSEVWCGTADEPPPLELERGKDDAVEGEESSPPVGLAMEKVLSAR
jgi:hypothetical protein